MDDAVSHSVTVLPQQGSWRALSRSITKASYAAYFRQLQQQLCGCVLAGALLGIITGTLVGMYAVSRIIAAVARQHLLPPFLAKVHSKFGTPYISTILQGVATAVIALFTAFDELLHLVSDRAAILFVSSHDKLCGHKQISRITACVREGHCAQTE